MARNKYPEETVRKILDVSSRLFREKGYDHTTIQDITEAMGMSRGAIYHHFKSKEEILDHITDRYYNEVNWFEDIRLDPSLNGREKIRELFQRMFSDPRKIALDHLAPPTLVKDPRLTALCLASSIRDAAPFFRQLVEEGVQDGSITVAQPKEFAEAWMVLMNMWVGIFAGNRDDFLSKVRFMRDFSDRMGLSFLDDSLIGTLAGYYDAVVDK